MKTTVMALTVMLVAGTAIAQDPRPVDPYGGTNSGAGRMLSMWPTPVDPSGPNSGAGRLAYDGSIVDPSWPKPNSGASYTFAMWPTPVDPSGPSSGAGRVLS